MEHSLEQEKTCLGCYKTDTTSFSTCRYCRRKYTKDSVKRPINPAWLYGSLIGVFFVLASIGGSSYYKAMRAIYWHKQEPVLVSKSNNNQKSPYRRVRANNISTH